LFAIGGLLGVIGALLWIIIVVVSVFFGKPIRGKEDMQLPIASPPPPAKEHNGFEAPGTLTLTILFLAMLLIMVTLNWGWLSIMWEVR
jgi:cytochrome c oxidase subunit 1